MSLFGGDERLRARPLATHIRELSTTQVGAAKQDRAGQTGPGGVGAGSGLSGAPYWAGTFSFSYERGPFEATVQERYINSGTYDATWCGPN